MPRRPQMLNLDSSINKRARAVAMELGVSLSRLVDRSLELAIELHHKEGGLMDWALTVEERRGVRLKHALPSPVPTVPDR